MKMDKMMRFTRRMRPDDVLRMFGLARRRSAAMWMIPAFGFLVLGAAVGAGIGMVFAPSSGRRMRQRVEGRLNQMRDRFKNNANNAISSNMTPNNQGI